ncbi:MAG: hypothetical protein GY868_16495 [Deltaproteobacteria bacterium]|nr:hypothetical protein [Deltaproteobacteria bacterium]
MKNCFTRAALMMLVAFAFAAQDAQASYEFYDGRLVLNGFVKETMYVRPSLTGREKPYRDTHIDYANTSALLETLYTVTDNEDYTLRLYGGVKAWWEKTSIYDDEQRRNIPHRFRKEYQYPRHFDDDILTEAYINIIKGPLELRVGKQIVIWGQLDMDRVADVVNPLDLRKGVPGIDTWEEIKRGVWMIRGLYQSELPGNLLFEFIFNPGDFRNMLLPDEGTRYGEMKANSLVSTSGVPDFGIVHWQFEKMRRDAPGFNFKHYEFGFKILGYFWNTDWSLIYFNSLSDTPVANPNRVMPFTMDYIASAIRGRPAPDWTDQKIYHYKRFQTIGGTAQTYLHWLSRTVWRAEWAYQIGVPMNKGTEGAASATYDWTRRDAFAVAVACSKSVNIPWFTRSWIATNRQFDWTLTYSYTKIFNHDHDLVLGGGGQGYNHSANDKISLFLKQDLFHMVFIVTFNGYYTFHTGKWMAVPTLTYLFPGVHWKMDVGYAAFGGSKTRHVSHTMSEKDSFILRLRYEF